MRSSKIPEVAIMRLSWYLRALATLQDKGVRIASSKELAQITGASPAQVRKDLGYFGEFGVRGLGYDVEELYNTIAKIIGTDRKWNVVIVGIGHLGGALVSYPGFLTRGFKVVAIFDINNIGSRYGNLTVRHIDDFREASKKERFDLGIIVVPGEAAQKVADIMIDNGIKSILNFAPVKINTPPEVEVKNVDLSMCLETLSYYMAKSEVNK